MSLMANYWADKSYAITLLSFDDSRTPPFYELNPRINYIPLGLKGDSRSFLEGVLKNAGRIRKLRRAIKASDPDIVISFIDKTNVTTLLATAGVKIPVIVSEHSDPEQCLMGSTWNRLRNITYSFASAVVTLNEKALHYFPQKIQANTHIIPNPVVVEPEHGPADKNKVGHTLISMGRLSEEKCFDLLIKAFANIKSDFPEWRLTILGEGPERETLEQLIDKLDISDIVDLPGNIKHPHPIIREADLYILSSRFEGFPCALCEAMACGLPVISTEYHSGVREIIDDGVNGALVPVGDIDTMSDTMGQLMADENKRNKLALNAIKISERFSLESVMLVWEELLGKTIERRN